MGKIKIDEGITRVRRHNGECSYGEWIDLISENLSESTREAIMAEIIDPGVDNGDVIEVNGQLWVVKQFYTSKTIEQGKSDTLINLENVLSKCKLILDKKGKNFSFQVYYEDDFIRIIKSSSLLELVRKKNANPVLVSKVSNDEIIRSHGELKYIVPYVEAVASLCCDPIEESK